jgi:hypothetical protein
LVITTDDEGRDEPPDEPTGGLVRIYMALHARSTGNTEGPMILISNTQRQPLQWLDWQVTVYYDFLEGLYGCHVIAVSYPTFLVPISPAKRLDRAIESAERIGA